MLASARRTPAAVRTATGMLATTAHLEVVAQLVEGGTEPGCGFEAPDAAHRVVGCQYSVRGGRTEYWHPAASPSAPPRRRLPQAACRSSGHDDPVQATKLALRSIAARVRALSDELRALDAQLATVVTEAAPKTVGTFALGPETASALLVAVGDNPERLRSEAAFARLCGVAPSPPRRARHAVTGCIAAGIATLTGRSTSRWSCACATARAPAPASRGARPRASPSPRSSAVSNATWPARSSARSAPTAPPAP